MNVMKSSSLLLKHIKKCIIDQKVRHIAASSKLVDMDVNGKSGIAVVTMKKHPVNSLSLELVNELTNAFMKLEKDKARGMVITSSAPGVFSAGLDIMELYKPNQDRVKSYWMALQDLWLHLYSSAYTTAAAISGHSPGGGCLIATSCDYRIMVKGNYTIGLNESQLGLAIPSWFIDSFTNVVPRRIAEMALISGKLFTVDEALQVGLIDQTAADNEEAVKKSLEYISGLSKFSMTAMAQTKLTLRYQAITHLQENREQDLRLFLKFVNSPDIQKGLEMYLEKLKSKK